MPRKSQVDLISISGIVSAQAQQELVTEGLDNFELPKSLVTSIARSALPDNAKLPKDTILALVKGSTVFINHLAGTAYDVAMSKQHKSISAADVMRALDILELGDMVEMIQEDLQAFRDEQRSAGKASGHDSVSLSASRLSVQPGAPTIRIKPPKKEPASRATSLSSYSRRQDMDSQGRAEFGEATPALYHNWQSSSHPDGGNSDEE
ncbi:histone-fold-containing protein [Guyanagaster necrorhizus]|uniref:DNA polymerase epsilon subunit D n=1 Tax=Guyanagaster necrorhizus TaxID=856835 RepID=A0A9P8AUC9_9AGAR|nr:histone-fold-containing protein [Guyanagaster necrorhizus MCA 3950]KAG7448130.1 histone-fold-containing protein [Guyanagaster necrorhizus MCA 3950]